VLVKVVHGACGADSRGLTTTNGGIGLDIRDRTLVTNAKMGVTPVGVKRPSDSAAPRRVHFGPKDAIPAQRPKRRSPEWFPIGPNQAQSGPIRSNWAQSGPIRPWVQLGPKEAIPAQTVHVGPLSDRNVEVQNGPSGPNWAQSGPIRSKRAKP